MDRRNFLIKSIGAAICAGLAPRLIPSLLPGNPAVIGSDSFFHVWANKVVETPVMNFSAVDIYPLLKELYAPDLVYAEMMRGNSFLNFVSSMEVINGESHDSV